MRRARLLVAMLLIGCSGSAPDDGAPGPEDMDQPTDVATSADSAVSQEDTPAAEDTEPEQDAGAGEDVPAPECPASTSAQAGVVATTRGAVGGTAESGGWTFLGVPYARPPIGELRFRPPQQPECWDDILPAKELAPKCPQLDGKVAPQFEGDEDCLYLNVWTPAAAGASPARPVLFFLHGGGNIAGSTAETLLGGKPTYDGRRLADGADAVVVTIQYRLGALGFLALDEMLEEDHAQAGNFGILDQVLALQWVQANIAAFGGDPAKVLLFGESAGAVDTCTLVASPLAAGLFSAALMQSGGCRQPEAAKVRVAMSERVDAETECGGAVDRLACLRAMAAPQLVMAMPGSHAIGSTTVGGDAAGYGPIVDGTVLLHSPHTAMQLGEHNHVPFAVGSNAEEEAKGLEGKVSTPQEYEQLLAQMFGALPGVLEKVKSAYPVEDYASPQEALVAVVTDVRFTCPAREIARAIAQGQDEPVYRYFFTRRATTKTGSTPAFHGVELLYVFGSLHNIGMFTPHEDDQALSQGMMRYWRRFAAAGDPNGGDDAAWPTYDVATDPHLVLDTPLLAADGVRTAQCDAWAAILTSLGL